MALTSLVVCADAKAVQVLSRILREMGIRAEHCGDPQTAAARLGSDHFDALLIDCVSNATENLITLAKSSALNKDTLTVAIVDASNDVREVFAKGANFVLYKPVSADRARDSLRAAQALMPNERRTTPRVRAHGPVTLAFASAENVPGSLIDLSEEGALIQANRSLPPQCKVYFQFTLPKKVSVVQLAGEVVWQDFMGRVGLRFARVPQSSRKMLDGWLKENLARQDEEVVTIPLVAPSYLPSQEGKPAKPVEHVAPSTSPNDRRVQLRQSCRLGAEVYLLGSRVPLRCNLSDISPSGCYVETMQPNPPGSVIEIVVRTQSSKVQVKGKVRSAHPGYGMGVEFEIQSEKEKEQVRQLIAYQTETSEAEQAPIELE